MACIVYRKGKGTIEHGIECESTTCEVNELHSLLNAGWSQTPPGYVPPEPVPVEEQDLDSTITQRFSGEGPAEGNVLQPEVDRLTAEVVTLNEQVDGLQKQLEIREGIESNLNSTVSQLREELDTARKIEDRLNSELAKLRKVPEAKDEPAEEIDPVRAQGRDAGIKDWDTMHLSSLKKALKELEA